jgi:ribosomal protein L20A (L18A)
MILEFINQYGYMILYAALTAIAGFLGAQIKKRIDRVTADEEKRKAVETVVKAVEQMYQDLSGREKLEKAKENILAILQSKGIAISEVEMDMLIEACVAEFNLAFLQKAKEERMEEMLNGNVSETR